MNLAEETQSELIQELKRITNAIDELPNQMDIKVTHGLSVYDNGALALPERLVKALESIADSLKNIERKRV